MMPDPTTPSTRLLIVDDEIVLMNALSDTLRERGFETVGFTSGLEALAALRDARFDLLLADLMMPEMDGIALLQAATDIDPDLVGIIMTGHGTIETAVEAMKSGAFDYILKPFRLNAVMPVLKRAVEVRRLRMNNTALLQRVQQRTTELEAANRELEAFAHSVSHDLRAPLRKLDVFSNMLVEDFADKIPAEAQDLLQRIAVNARQMGQLINALLRFSRLSQHPLSRESIDVVALIGEVVAELRTEERNQALVVHIQPIPAAEGDPPLIRQVFYNLLSNAFKFTRHKENGRIEVGCTKQDGETVYFVKDNGAGFDMKYASRLFQVFQQLHSAGSYEGTGIGLSIVQRIVKRHGGCIWAEAAVEQGATFFFTLPPEDSSSGQ